MDFLEYKHTYSMNVTIFGRGKSLAPYTEGKNKQ